MRNTNINTNRKRNTDVKISTGGMINFEAAADGSHDADDQAWNAFKFYGQTDLEERSYAAPKEVDPAASERAAKYMGSRRMGRRILTLLGETAYVGGSNSRFAGTLKAARPSLGPANLLLLPLGPSCMRRAPKFVR